MNTWTNWPMRENNGTTAIVESWVAMDDVEIFGLLEYLILWQ